LLFLLKGRLLVLWLSGRLPCVARAWGIEGEMLSGQWTGNSESTLLEAIRSRADRNPNAVAVISTYGPPITFAALLREIARFRRQIRRVGLQPESRVALFPPANVSGVLLSIAAPCACVGVQINPHLTHKEVMNLLGPLLIDAVIAPSEHRTARALADNRGVPLLPLASGPLEIGLQPLDKGSCPAVVDQPDDSELDDCSKNAFILFTSGTSGDSKRVLMTHGNMLSAARRLRDWFALSEADRCLHVSPACYSHGLMVTVWTPLITGGSIAVPSSLTSIDFNEWLSVLGPTWYSAGPALHQSILRASTFANGKIPHSLRFIVSGGAPLAARALETLQSRFGVPVLEHYGMTEAGQMAANLSYDGKQKVGTCGITEPGTVRIVKPDGESAAPGEYGEILLRGPTVTPGYLEDPDTCRIAFRDGWFRTGDLGSLDEDGFLTIHGRIAELINRGTEKISPADVERVLEQHPDVLEAAAFGIPHTALGQDCAAAVVLRDGAVQSQEELRRFAMLHLAPSKIPREIIVRSALPRGRTGKVSRRRLAQLHQATTVSPRAADDVISPLENALIEIWRRLLKHDGVKLDDDFFELGGDSFHAVEMALAVESELRIRVPEALLFQLTTVRGLAQALEALVDATNIGMIRAGASSGDSPLFFFHGDFECGGLYARRLLNRISADQPIFLVPPHKLQSDEAPHSIQEMASDRLSLIEQAAPCGSIRLGGYCNGALLAYELAQLLTQRGRAVEVVIMIDPPGFNVMPPIRALHYFLRVLCKFFVQGEQRSAVILTAAWTPVAGLFERIEQASRRPLRRMISAATRALNIRVPMHGTTLSNRNQSSLSSLRERAKYRVVVRNYFPSATSVPLLIVSAGYRSAHWVRCSKQASVVDVPFDHKDCIGPGLDSVVRVIRL
jgi:acyl-CoA synthetase (AMP-forming)/AMP-acid ligase II/thioesterase domain-containing protein/acyl carrier protein